MQASVMQPITSGVNFMAVWANQSYISFKSLEKENERLKRIVAELELDKLILKESLDYLKPRA